VEFSGLVQLISDAGPLIALGMLVWVIKAWMDARVRGKLVASTSSQELVRAVLSSDEERRRLAPLRWGMVLTCLAAALAIIDAAGWQEATPGVFAILLAATGLGNLGSFPVMHWLRSRGPADHPPAD
jgi:hypothetical protein